MFVLPVIDLLNGIVVRGVAGQRSQYQPLKSTLTTSTLPLDVARSLRSSFGFIQFYLADLDAILHERPNWDGYRKLIDDGFELLIDAGIRDVEQSLRVRRMGAEPIIGLELCPSPDVLAKIVAANEGRITFSLDLMNGRPILCNNAKGWRDTPLEVARQSIAAGVTSMIVLDLSDVGTSSGGRTEPLCRSLANEFPDLCLICGGGVRGPDDLKNFHAAGASGMLVASALHDGRLTAEDVSDSETFAHPYLPAR